MAGFPTRHSRSAFGPKRTNRRPVVNPLNEIGQEHYNLAFWQLAGLNMTGAIAVAVINVDGTLEAHAEAWDPDRKTVGPTGTKVGTGHYRLTYSTSYADQDGNDVTLGFFGAHATPQSVGSSPLIANAALAAPNIVEVKLFTPGAVATDASVMVWIY